MYMGYIAHKKHPSRRTLQHPYAEGPMVILWGWVFLMSEVPLYVREEPTWPRAHCTMEGGAPAPPMILLLYSRYRTQKVLEP